MIDRKYLVIGRDSEGDVHSFSTNDPDRAKATLNQFREDLEDVEMREGPERNPNE